MNDNNKFKNRLKELRKEFEMTQQDLANKIGIVRTAIANYETGRTIPDSETLSIIAKIFKTTTDYLLGNSDIRNPYNEDKQEYIVPEEFTDPMQAREYVNKHQIFGFSGFDSDKLDDEEIVRFANELLEQMKMVSYKYKK